MSRTATITPAAIVPAVDRSYRGLGVSRAVQTVRDLAVRTRANRPPTRDAGHSAAEPDLLEGHPEAAAWVVDEELRVVSGPTGAVPFSAASLVIEPVLEEFSLARQDDVGIAHIRALAGSHAYTEVRRGDRDWLVRVAPRAAVDEHQAVAVAVDVTELAQRTASVIDAVKALSRPGNPNAAVASVLGGICARLGWHSASLWLLDPATGALACAARQSIGFGGSLDSRDAPGELVREVWQARAPRLRSEATDGWRPVLADRDEPVCAVPVTSDGHLLGVLSCSGTATASRGMLRALEAIGALVGQYLHLLQALERSSRVEDVVEQATGLVEMVSPSLAVSIGDSGHSTSTDADEMLAVAPAAAPPQLADDSGDPTVLPILERVVYATAPAHSASLLTALERLCALYSSEDEAISGIEELLQASVLHADRLADASVDDAGLAKGLDQIRSAARAALVLSSNRARLRAGAPLALVVSSDLAARARAASLLAGLGFATLAAKDAAGAEALSRRHRRLISLLVTDLIIAPISGMRLAIALGKEQPGMRVVCLSPTSRADVVEMGPRGEEVPVVATPIVPREFEAAVGAALLAKPARRVA